MIANKKKNLLIAAALVTVLNFQSCKKYDDGPSFSLRSVKNRLAGEWEVVDAQGLDLDGDITFEFEKNGDFKFTYGYDYPDGSTYTYSYSGGWEFEDGKKTIEITLNGETPSEFEIKRLTNKEFWIEDEDNLTWELEKL